MTLKILNKLVGKYSNSTSLEVDNTTIFSFLCLTLLSHRTNDLTVNKLKVHFLDLKTSKCLLKKSFFEIKEKIKSVNYNYKKTKILFHVAKYIENNCNGKVSNDFHSLIKIPFVGPKTSSLVSSKYSQETKYITIDTHVKRFFERFFEKKKYTYLEENKMIKSNTSKKNWKNISDTIIGFAKKICTYKPKCNFCVLKKNCFYYKNNI